MNLNNTLQLGFDSKLVNQAQSAGQANAKDAEKIRGLAKQFEGFFIYMTLEQMSQGLQTEEGIMGGGHAEKIWRSTLNEKMSDVISNANHSGYGISQAIERQLLQLQEVGQ